MALHMIMYYSKVSLSSSPRLVHIILEHTKTVARYSIYYRYILVYVLEIWLSY